jgi:hypothetical protein
MGYRKDLQQRESQDTKWLARAYQLLKDHTPLKIHRSPAHGYSTAQTTLSYAKEIDADLIVINPTESRPGTWVNHFFGKSIYSRSDIPVLTIARQPD